MNEIPAVALAHQGITRITRPVMFTALYNTHTHRRTLTPTARRSTEQLVRPRVPEEFLPVPGFLLVVLFGHVSGRF